MPQDIESIHAATLGQLYAAREAMTSLEWRLALDEAPPARREQSGELLNEVQTQILRLENAALEDLADAMAAHRAPLQRAIAGVEAQLEKLAKIEKALAAVAALVGVVVKIAPKLAGLRGLRARAKPARSTRGGPARKPPASGAGKRKTAKRKTAKRKTAKRKTAKRAGARRPAKRR